MALDSADEETLGLINERVNFNKLSSVHGWYIYVSNVLGLK